MASLVTFLTSPLVKWVFMLLVLAVFFGPLIVIRRWYFRQIRSTEGGRKLLKDHAANPAVNHPAWLGHNLEQAAKLQKNLSRGAYGEATKRLHRRLYVYLALWLLASSAMIGLLFLVDALQ